MRRLLFTAVLAGLTGCSTAVESPSAAKPTNESPKMMSDAARPPEKLLGPEPQMDAPYASKSVKANPKVVGWPEGKMPVAAQGFKVQKFAGDMKTWRTRGGRTCCRTAAC